MPVRAPSHSLSGKPKQRSGDKTQAERRRGSASSRGYDRTWQKLRLAKLQANPLCECDDCKRTGAVIAADVVDHIDGNAWNRDWDNLRSMCKSHHDRRTAREQAFGRKKKVNQNG